MLSFEDYGVKTLGKFVGHKFDSAEPILVDQERINLFASATGDHQWIHVDVDRAEKESPFGKTIAHGFLTLSLLAADVIKSGVIPRDVSSVLNYGLGKVRFLAPVGSGAEVTATYEIKSADDKGDGRTLLTVSCVLGEVQSDRPAVVAELLAMVIE